MKQLKDRDIDCIYKVNGTQILIPDAPNKK